MRQTLIFALLLCTGLSLHASATGTLCMAAFKPPGAEVSEPIMSPAADFVAPSTLRIVIAKQSAEVDSEKAAQFTLRTKPKHLIEIWQNDKRKLSFWLKFSDYESSELCLWHKPFYGTISVIEASDPRCGCKAAKSAY